MASFGRQFSRDSPVLAMSPQPVYQSSLMHQQFPPQIPGGITPAASSSATAIRPGCSSLNRKRSRDEAAANLEPDPLPPTPHCETAEQWEYGPGMVLIKSNEGYVADASSQSGTWLEEKNAAVEENRHKLEAEHLAPRNHKSQRIATNCDADNGKLSAMSSLPNASDISTPIVDAFTLQLGIGWRRISDDEHIQAAARGWARYIENHFPVTDAKIRLESKGLQSYLVEATEGFFLFDEDLRQGRLVSMSVENTLRNLQTSPPTFDGIDAMFAAGTPTPSTQGATHRLANDNEMQLD